MSVHGHHGVHCVIVGIIVDEFGHSTQTYGSMVNVGGDHSGNSAPMDWLLHH